MRILDTDISTFIEGLFALNTRRFGTVAEIMIKKLYEFQWSRTRVYDLYDQRSDARIEVKFSRATREHSEAISELNVINQCMTDAFLENRSLNSYDLDIYSFDSNIQQIKCRNFDFLFYGLFFTDCVEIYGIESHDVYNVLGYSDHQHAGNVGEGQFHLNNSSIDFHRQNCLKRVLTYYDLFTLLNC